MEMPPPQMPERRAALTDDDWARLMGQCAAVVKNARGACRKADDEKVDCDEEYQKPGTECVIEASRSKLTDDTQHKECNAPAVQGVVDYMKAKHNTKTDNEFNDIIKKKCLAVPQKANDECRGKTDFGNKCERQPNEATLQCLLDNAKARADNDFAHNLCSVSAIAAANECVFNKKESLPKCQRQQWDAYPECAKKNAPQNPTATKPAQDECSS